MDKSSVPIKGLVRNTKMPVPSVQAKIDGSTLDLMVVPRLCHRSKTAPVPAKASSLMQRSDISLPATKHVRQPKRSVQTLYVNTKAQPKTTSDLVTRSVNFPQSKAVYKNLIPLSEERVVKPKSYTKPVEQVPSSADIVPVLEKNEISSNRQQSYYIQTFSSIEQEELFKGFKGNKEYKQHGCFL